MATTIPETPAAASAVASTIDLSGDDLGLATAPHIRAAAKQALDNGETHYTTRPGLDPLREAVSQSLLGRSGIRVDPKTEVIITSGTQEALFIALHVLLEPGDSALVCRPSRPAYGDIAAMAGGTVLAIKGEPAASFAVDPERVARRITSGTRVLVLGSPLVPAGVVHDEDTLRRLAALAVEHNLAVITDEEFEPFIFDGSRHINIGALPGMAERTITIGGFSFTYAMRGWRVGYMAGPQQIMASMMKLKQALSICSAAVSQFAALAAITGPRTPVEEAYSLLAGRRRTAFAALDRVGIPYVRSAAGPYVLIRGSEAARSDRTLVKHLAQEMGVLLSPGSIFGVPSWLRLSLAQPDERIAEAITRLRPALGTGGSNGH